VKLTRTNVTREPFRALFSKRADNVAGQNQTFRYPVVKTGFKLSPQLFVFRAEFGLQAKR
jgi:hypothetical protein